MNWEDFTTAEEMEELKQALQRLGRLKDDLFFTARIIESYAMRISRRMCEAEARQGLKRRLEGTKRLQLSDEGLGEG